MARIVCVTCGANYPPPTPASCKICEDFRAYVPLSGQKWTTWAELGEQGVSSAVEPDPQDSRIRRLTNDPRVAIGQTPILVLSAHGSLIWDSTSYLSPSALTQVVELVRACGAPFKGIAVSHPHFYGSSATILLLLREELGDIAADARIWVNERDKEWWTDVDGMADVVFEKEEVKQLTASLKLVRCGGHFPGSSILIWDRSKEPEGSRLPATGVAFTGDTILPTPAGTCAFMLNFVTLIPLPPQDVAGIWHAVRPHSFEVMLGAWKGQTIAGGARDMVRDSARSVITGMGQDPADFRLD